jgi:hypothetical protein
MEEYLIRKRKWFMAWQDQEEEAWLEEMSKQGLHFQKVNRFGVYTFEQGVPVHYAYRLDYQTSVNDEEQYLQIFQDLGWKYLNTLNGWRYFRQEVKEGKIPEIFTDADTKIKKYERIQTLLIAMLPLYTLVVVLHISLPDGEPWGFRWWSQVCGSAFSIPVFGALVAVSVIALYKLNQRIQTLRQL